MDTIDTRAVTMLVPIGVEADCAACDRLIKFVPPGKGKLIVANVYEGRGKRRHWSRVENWHPECYEGKGQPYGEAPVRKAQISSRTSW